jgi:hypothetical protein
MADTYDPRFHYPRYEKINDLLGEATADDLRAVSKVLSAGIRDSAAPGYRLSGELWNLLCDEWARRGEILTDLEEDLDDRSPGQP